MKQFLLMIGMIFGLASRSIAESDVVIIPQPMKITRAEGTLSFARIKRITFQQDAGVKNEASYIADFFKDHLHQTLPIVQATAPADGVLFIALDAKLLDQCGEEGYRLSITPIGITIHAATPAGIFYAFQTLRQLLPANIEAGTSSDPITLPVVLIEDRPRFGWRGLMLDEARHFAGEDYVKKLLDQMAMLKLNRFHWHLTDDEGWRIEIKQYPKLTAIGGQGDWSNREGKAQFYTQIQIKEIVAYAAKLHIEIIPEIDMPGHASAANRAYPENDGGGFDRLPQFTFNPGRDQTYIFLTNICKEVAELFPTPYLHIGGDEASFGWKGWPELVELKPIMQKEGLKTSLDIDHYFKRCMCTHVSNIGKIPAMWDEGVDAGVDATKLLIFWWRHDKPEQFKKAIEHGHNVIMCPRDPMYFDYAQDASHKVIKRIKTGLTMDRIIAFPKLPETFRPEQRKQVLGIQANLWTESVDNDARRNYLFFPRAIAVAESAWCDESTKNYDNFMKRLPNVLARLKAQGTNYYDPFNPQSTPELPSAVKAK